MIKIYTDSCSDIPSKYLDPDIKILPLHYYFSNEKKEYGEDINLTMREFFLKIKQGKIPYTSSVNPDYAVSVFMRDVLMNNKIICICMSSGLSSTYQNVSIAKDEILEEYPDAKIAVIDSLTGSLAEGLITLKANEMRKQGKKFEEIVDYIERYKNYYHINFFVNDLEYLKRSGRISNTKCAIGTALGIKPLIQVDYEGRAVNTLNCRGIKKCDNILLNKFIDEVDSNETIGIVHSDDLVSAKRLEEKIRQLNISDDIIIGEISPTIASHIGPKAFGLTYKVKQKTRI